jgi:hypothetical protein
MDDYNEIQLPYDTLFNFEGYDIYETKFNNMSMLQMKQYDNKTYIQDEKIVVKNDKGDEEVKNIPPASYIRWRYSNENDVPSKEKELDSKLGLTNDHKILSNSKIVEWSDGSYQLIIGDQYYDIKYSDMDNIRFGISSNNNENIVVNQKVQQRMILTPCESQGGDRIKHTEDSTKVKLAYNYYNPNEYKKEDYGNTKYSKNKFKDVFEKKSK